MNRILTHLLALLLLTLGEPVASALHTALSRATPAVGSRVTGEVRELRLAFTTAVQLPLSEVRVVREGGTPVSGRLAYAVDSGETELVLTLDLPLAAGAHQVSWQTAGPDGHVIRGEYGFTVAAAGAEAVEDAAEGGAGALLEGSGAPGGAGAAEESGAGMSDPGMSGGAGVSAAGDGGVPAGAAPSAPGVTGGPLGVWFRWIQYMGIALILGGIGFRFGVVPPLMRGGEAAVAENLLGRLVGLMRMGAVLVTISLPLRLWAQSVATWGGEALNPGRVATLLLRTPWGTGWLVQAAAVALVFVGFSGLRAERPKARWGVVALGALGLAVTPALSGHAWGIEPRWLGVTLSAGHLIGMGVWIGGLAALVLAALPALRQVRGDGAELPGLAGVVNAFSRVALPAVVLLVVTGAGQNLNLLGSPANLIATAWGRTLLVKLALTGAAMALGLYNWRVVRPALAKTPRGDLLRIPSTIELLIGLTVLVVTALLVVQGVPE
jgi:copper transport protein